MTQALLIRRAGLTEVTALWDIEKQSFPSPWSLWCFLAEFANSKSTILVAGPAPPRSWEVWGYLIYWLVVDEMHIMNLAVHPRHRRQGVARALLREALAQARSRGAVLAWLEVRPSNLAAQALYRAFGFEEVGRRPRYYADSGEDALLFALTWNDEE